MTTELLVAGHAQLQFRSALPTLRLDGKMKLDRDFS
jgi:hypothetical protein